jgi:ATP-dependent RNA helicase DDX56/DBP9
MGSLLDETVTWAEFGRRYLDRRVSKAVTKTLGLERPTLVQSRGIPVALEGKDLLCRARTGSGKTLCYSIPLIHRLLTDSEASSGSLSPLRGIILVPTKELVAQVHGVVMSLLSFCFDVISAAALLSGEKYMKAELPTILVTTPSSLVLLLKQRKSSMQPLASTLKTFIIDEADLMFSFGYEDDMRSLCAYMPSTYQAMLFSATLSEEVEKLKGLMLHKPVVLKLEEPRVTGKLSQFYLICHKDDKYLIVYTLLKLQLISGKTLLFVKSVEAAYRMKMLLERFSINCAVLNSDLPHNTRQDIIQSFNQNLVELLVATDSGLGADPDDDDDNGSEGEDDEDEDDMDEEAEDEEHGEDGEAEAEDEEDEEEEEDEEPVPPPMKKARKGKGKDDMVEAISSEAATKKKSRKSKKAKEADEENQEEEDEEEEPMVASVKVVKAHEGQSQLGKKMRRASAAEQQYSLVRGVDLKDVSTVINADMPATVRDYVHRVGRCARGGASGTALTLCVEEEEPKLRQIMRSQASSAGAGGGLRELPLQMSDVERFRYRVEDMARGLTKRNIAQYRARELQVEALNSEKLQEYFQDHPEEKKALQKAQRSLKEKKSIRQHLRHVPFYLVPEQFVAATPVQQAVRDEAAKTGGKVSNAVKRRRYMQAKKQDPLQSCEAGPVKGKRKRSQRFTREAMEAKEKRIDHKTANIEDLPPMSGRKLWKLRHGKTVRKKTDQFGERRRMTYGQRRRKGKFAADS